MGGPVEPSAQALRSPVLRLVLATRPPFLAVTLVACLIGWATAASAGVALRGVTVLLTGLFALVAHAGINVLNDYYDALNGTDAINTERVFPFTGGSRFIQNGVLSLRATGLYGALLMLCVIPAGLWLAREAGVALLWIGAAGLFIGWAYSAPPLNLNGRGAGELCVWAGFALVAAGADCVQRGGIGATPWWASAGYALLVTNILFINQFPDRRADEACGKHHWVVRLGVHRAARVYALLAGLAHVWLLLAVALGLLGPWVLLATVTAVPAWWAARHLRRHADQPAALAPAIRLTIACALAHGALIALGLMLGA